MKKSKTWSYLVVLINLGDSVIYTGLVMHKKAVVVGIDHYTARSNQWKSFTISSDTNSDLESQTRSGDRWWLTYDGYQLREWVALDKPIEQEDLGEKINDFSGSVSISFLGDRGLSTSSASLATFSIKSRPSHWYCRETFFSENGSKHDLIFVSSPVRMEDISLGKM